MHISMQRGFTTVLAETTMRVIVNVICDDSYSPKVLAFQPHTFTANVKSVPLRVGLGAKQRPVRNVDPVLEPCANSYARAGSRPAPPPLHDRFGSKSFSVVRVASIVLRYQDSHGILLVVRLKAT
jgi:hypothetical protein